MRVRRRALFIAVLVTLLVGGSFTVAHISGARSSESPVGDLASVLEVISLVKTQYVDPVDATDLIRAYVNTGSISGMLKEVLKDPYTRYLDPQAFRQMQIDTSGEFAGIGIVVGLKDEKVVVVAPIENTPAHRFGLRGGDHIVSIDGKSTDLMSLDEAVSLMRGKEGTSVTLGIEREKTSDSAQKTERFEAKLTRAVIQVPSVTDTEVLSGPTWHLNVPFGYVRLAQFSERSGAELDNALQSLDKQHVQGYILDLRNNPGGLLAAAVEVSSQFLSGGPIVHIVGRDREKKTLSAFANAAHGDLPLVVLVNENSASASEIVSGALQDRHAATLVGARTFGKGLVQVVIPMQDGSALSLTSARYQTAGGRFIHEKGIEPDVTVPLDESQKQNITTDSGKASPTDPQLRKALEILQARTREVAAAQLKRAG